MKVLFFLFSIILMSNVFAQQIIIQENELGFCSVDGSIMTSVAGYTGDGYADTDFGPGKSISWSIFSPTGGICYLQWRYGNGGGGDNRPARLLINNKVEIDTVDFPHTGVWTNWTISDSISVNLVPGNNVIRIEAYASDGLGNYDYLIADGENISPSDCTPSFVFSISKNIEEAGTVSYEPVQDYYEEGTTITVHAAANSGYFFQSWSGEEADTNLDFSFSIKQNTNLTAMYYPEGTRADENLTGYASVQSDNGTPYMLIGGLLGDTVTANSASELNNYLSDELPRVVKFQDYFTGTDIIEVKSNKTLLGIGDNAHLEGIQLSINSARNVIIRNVKVSKVTPKDAVEINGASKNIWIDSCDFSSDRDHGTEFYDGLLDIKNESAFITVSWTKFHDHYKTILISSGDQQVADTTIRVTFHHNYFYNCESRLPSIRFGKAHIFNNYYKNDGTSINSRMGACVRVEKNYFNNVNKSVMMEYSTEKGSVQLIDNYYGSSTYYTEPACELDVPYDYSKFLDPVEDIPMIVAGDITGLDNEELIPVEFSLQNYPNPFNPSTVIEFSLPVRQTSGDAQHTSLKIYNILGKEIATLVNGDIHPGKYKIKFDGRNLSSGVYFCILKTGAKMLSQKLVLIK